MKATFYVICLYCLQLCSQIDIMMSFFSSFSASC